MAFWNLERPKRSNKDIIDWNKARFAGELVFQPEDEFRIFIHQVLKSRPRRHRQAEPGADYKRCRTDEDLLMILAEELRNHLPWIEVRARICNELI